MAKINSKLGKWLRWIEIIKDEVQDLVVAKHTFHEVQGMIRNNPRLHQHSSFYNYLARTYVSHVVIGIRRQIKCDTQSISMTRLFTEMIESPQTLPRTYYTAKYMGSVESLADRDFDKFAVPDGPHIDPNLISSDLANLQAASKCCEYFADRRIAHRDTREPKKLATFNEVDACIDLLDELYVKYHLLFHAAAKDTLLPTWQYDWKAVFRVSWLPPSENN